MRSQSKTESKAYWKFVGIVAVLLVAGMVCATCHRKDAPLPSPVVEADRPSPEVK